MERRQPVQDGLAAGYRRRTLLRMQAVLRSPAGVVTIPDVAPRAAFARHFPAAKGRCMTVLLALTLALVPADEPFPFAAAEAELSEEITVAELQAHVYRLASPEFLGRRGPGAARAARHIAAAFERLKLQPAFGDSYYQDIPWLLADRGQESFVGRNVAAVLEGTD